MLQPRRTARHSENKFLITVLAISLAFFLLVLIEPLGSSNAVLHSMALDLVRYGRFPYIGSWDNNFPGIAFLHAIGIVLFGESKVTFRIFDILIELLFVAFLFKFLSRWLQPHAATLAAVLYAAYYVATSNIYGTQDPYGMMLVLVGTAMILPRKNEIGVSLARIAAGGLFAGLSFLMRPTFVLFIGILGLYILLQTDFPSILSRISRLFLFAVFAMIPSAALLFYYSTIPGGVDTLYTSTIRFNLDLYTKLGGVSFWIEILRSGLMIPLAIAAIVFKAIKQPEIFKTPPSKKEAGLFIAFVAAGLFIVLYMGKYWRYHFAPFYMALIPFSAVGIERVMLRVRDELRRHYVMLGCVLFSTFIAYNPIGPIAFALGLLEHSNPFQTADEARRPSPLYGAKPEHALLAYLEKPENQSGGIEYCGFDPYLRLDLHRPFVGRYTTFHALAFRTDATKIGPPHYTDYQRKWQTDYVRLLEQAKPRFIVLGREMPFWYIHDIYTDCLRYLPGFDSFFQSNYRYDTAFGGFQVYGRAK
ncbi:MAG: ArnT family glycosyltransferase [Candidatus Kapaibacterium sp.]